MPDYVLALDQGTTSSRAVVFDKKGQIAAKSQREFEQLYPQAGWVEHNPMDILYSEYQSISTVLSEGKIRPADIRAIGITNQRETSIIWNRKTGLPLCNAIVWQCRRTAPLCEKLKEIPGFSDYVREHSGLVLDAYFSATKLKWMLDNVPQARQLAKDGLLLFGTVETWLIWNLTGGAFKPDKAVHVTDYSNACRTMLFDADRLRWDEYLCDTLGIPLSVLPRPVPSSMVYGETAHGIQGLEELGGIPISGAIGDQPAALFGQGCFEPGMAKNTYGTGCFLLMNTGEKRVHSKNSLVSGVAWGIGDKVEYDIEGSAFNAGCVIKWLRDELRLIDSAPRCDELAESVSDSNGVVIVPAFTGLGAPYWDMYARGCIMGLTRGVNRAHLSRAVLEAICFQVNDLAKAVESDSGIAISSLRADGGASVSNIMLQIQANLLNIEVNRPSVTETTALGAAYMAGLSTGVWSSLSELKANRKTEKIFLPEMSEEERERLLGLWKKAVRRSMDWAEH